MVDLDNEMFEKLDALQKQYNIENRIDAPPMEFQREYAGIIQLYLCKKRMQEAGVTDESLIFNIGEVLGGKVGGSVDATPKYSFDEITADYIEVYKGGHRFKVSGKGDKVSITRMY